MPSSRLRAPCRGHSAQALGGSYAVMQVSLVQEGLRRVLIESSGRVAIWHVVLRLGLLESPSPGTLPHRRVPVRILESMLQKSKVADPR